MPTSAIRGEHFQRGFTLLELMLVLVILALGSLLLVPNIGSMDSRSFPAQIREASNQLNYARRNAVVTGQPRTARFELLPPEEREQQQEQEPITAAALREQDPVWQAGSISTEYLDVAGESHRDAEVVEIVFYPEGGSTGGEFHFSQGSREATISIDPFTGRISTLLN